MRQLFKLISYGGTIRFCLFRSNRPGQPSAGPAGSGLAQGVYVEKKSEEQIEKGKKRSAMDNFVHFQPFLGYFEVFTGIVYVEFS
jgi:hypothetical protein